MRAYQVEIGWADCERQTMFCSSFKKVTTELKSCAGLAFDEFLVYEVNITARKEQMLSLLSSVYGGDGYPVDKMVTRTGKSWSVTQRGTLKLNDKAKDQVAA